MLIINKIVRTLHQEIEHKLQCNSPFIFLQLPKDHFEFSVFNKWRVVHLLGDRSA